MRRKKASDSGGLDAARQRVGRAAFPSPGTPEFRNAFATHAVRRVPPGRSRARGVRGVTCLQRRDPNPAGLGWQPGRARSRETSLGRCRVAGACRIGGGLGPLRGRRPRSFRNSITTSASPVKGPGGGPFRPRTGANCLVERRSDGVHRTRIPPGSPVRTSGSLPRAPAGAATRVPSRTAGPSGGPMGASHPRSARIAGPNRPLPTRGPDTCRFPGVTLRRVGRAANPAGCIPPPVPPG